MLLKGLSEVEAAPAPLAAAEMVLRMAYAAELPTPGDAVKALQDGSASVSSAGTSSPQPSNGGGSGTTAVANGVVERAEPAPQPASAPEARVQQAPQAHLLLNLDAVAALATELREGLLVSFLENQVRVKHFEPGKLEFSADDGADREMRSG